MKRKCMYNNMPNALKTKIYEYDNTYRVLYNKVLSELIETYETRMYKKLKNKIIKILKYDWLYNIESVNCLTPKLNFNIILKALKDNITDVISINNIKFILRSLCHYNNSDLLKSPYNENLVMYPNREEIEIESDNGYIHNHTVRDINIEISKFLKNIIDENKLTQFITDYIDESNIPLEKYIESSIYNDFKYDILEYANTITVFRNYDYLFQPHLYNYKLLDYYNEYDEYHRKLNAQKLYITQNGKTIRTIQIRYNDDTDDLFIYELEYDFYNELDI